MELRYQQSDAIRFFLFLFGFSSKPNFCHEQNNLRADEGVDSFERQYIDLSNISMGGKLA